MGALNKDAAILFFNILIFLLKKTEYYSLWIDKIKKRENMVFGKIHPC